MAFADQLGLSFGVPERRIWTVGDLVAAVRSHIERDYADAWVEGEISNLRAQDSGHLYFTLKDENSQLSAVMFRSQARLLRFRPENGMRVVLRGRITIYEDRGQLQISVEYIEPRGAGAMQIAFEQLKARLEAEGLFAAARKRPIPTLPRSIGIVTSPQAAALRDILNILQRRHKTANILIFPATVQGDSVAAEVSAGIKYFNQAASVDVIVVARGGGSAEDLSGFNHEGLARTIGASVIPVISAIGHETDFTIVDFVADLRAPTPSAAAELVIRSRQEVEQQSEGLLQRLEHAMRYRLLMGMHVLAELAQHGAFARMRDLINRRHQATDDLQYRLENAERRILEQHRRRLEAGGAAVRHYDARRTLSGIRKEVESAVAALTAATRTSLLKKRSQLENLSSHLDALSPLAVLERGYALIFDGSGRLVKSSAQLNPGDEISARVARGRLTATVLHSHE